MTDVISPLEWTVLDPTPTLRPGHQQNIAITEV